MPKSYFEVVQKGMYLVVNGSGTAKNIKNADYSIAVSYTHLDVYKRQAYGCGYRYRT